MIGPKLDLEYDGLLFGWVWLSPTDWKSVVQRYVNGNFQLEYSGTAPH